MLFVFREFLRLCNGIIYSYSFSVPSPSPPFLLELLLFLGCLLLIFKLFSFLWLCLLRFVGYEYARARICVAKALNHPKKQKLLLCIKIYDCIYYPFCTFSASRSPSPPPTFFSLPPSHSHCAFLSHSLCHWAFSIRFAHRQQWCITSIYDEK